LHLRWRRRASRRYFFITQPSPFAATAILVVSFLVLRSRDAIVYLIAPAHVLVGPVQHDCRIRASLLQEYTIVYILGLFEERHDVAVRGGLRLHFALSVVCC
jgi:hypothetical protein